MKPSELEIFRQARFFLPVVLVGLLLSQSARAQFVPGHIFGVHHTNNFCKDDGKWPPTPLDAEIIYEMDPYNGTWKIFATIPRELCGYISGGMAFSPDGKRLRVASLLLGLIWEFDAQGSRSVALDWMDGVAPAEGCNAIAFDQESNFYLSNYPSEVLKFPAGGGPPVVLADYAQHGVSYPRSLAVGSNGVVYVASHHSTTQKLIPQVIRITPDGEVTVVDRFPAQNDSIVTLAVDQLDRVYIKTGLGRVYRYQGGDPNSRELFSFRCELGGPLPIYTLISSADRKQICGRACFSQCPIVSIDLIDGSARNLAVGPIELSCCGLTTVPLRGDVDGDRDSDLNDLEALVICMRGPGTGVPMAKCDLADMDADGDVDLNDAQFFLLGHSSFWG